MVGLSKRKIKVADQRAGDLVKMNDLQEHFDSNQVKAVWVVDHERFTWNKGESKLTAGNHVFELDGTTKTDAKRKIFELTR